MSCNVSNPIFQLPLDCRHQPSCPMTTSSSCSPTPSSTSAAPGKETWFGPNLCRRTPSCTPGTTRPHSSSTTRQWRIPGTTCVRMKAPRVSRMTTRKRTMRREYTCLSQVNMGFHTVLKFKDAVGKLNIITGNVLCSR